MHLFVGGDKPVGPSLLVDSRMWQLDALCRDHDPATFFGSSDSDHDASGSEKSAKAICAPCPVREHCLAHALATEEQFGVWGGLTARERRQYKWFNYRRPVGGREDRA